MQLVQGTVTVLLSFQNRNVITNAESALNVVTILGEYISSLAAIITEHFGVVAELADLVLFSTLHVMPIVTIIQDVILLCFNT